MDHSPLDRVQQDLDVIKAALPADFPYDRGSVGLCAAAGLCGVLFALRAIPGWEQPMTAVLLVGVAGLVLASGGWWRRARSERGTRPRRWSWARQEMLAGAVAIVAVIVYAVLTRRVASEVGEWTFEAWRAQLAAPALFAIGVGAVSLGVMRPERRHILGWGLAMTALGLAMPWVPSRATFWAVGGGLIAVGFLVSTTILWWQLRQWEAGNGHH